MLLVLVDVDGIALSIRGGRPTPSWEGWAYPTLEG
jgi:hypothetical protein